MLYLYYLAGHANTRKQFLKWVEKSLLGGFLIDTEKRVGKLDEYSKAVSELDKAFFEIEIAIADVIKYLLGSMPIPESAYGMKKEPSNKKGWLVLQTDKLRVFNLRAEQICLLINKLRPEGLTNDDEPNKSDYVLNEGIGNVYEV